MANWCTNRLVIRGEPDALDAVRAAVRGLDDDGRELLIDFDRIAPTPEEVKTSPPPVSPQAIELLDRYSSLPPDDQQAFARKNSILVTMVTRLMTGASRDDVCRWDPQTWREVNWGTKWTPSVENITVAEDEPDRWVIQFDTPWSPPLAIVRRLAETFPNAEFELLYSEPDSDLAGVIRCTALGCEEVTPDSVYEVVSLFQSRGWTTEADSWLASIGEDVDE